ncbi:MAG: hypothetical protein E6J79_11905 [Deltaproteobacteria bacterium]|nr:MAG: hypothetical protein E6J79_11905 [Deltaproteobacteria bacterium]
MKTLAAVVIGLVVLPAAVCANHVEPAKANGATFSLVTGFFECGSPNTATSSGASACAPPVSTTPCGFTSGGGSGKLTFAKVGSAAKGTQDLKITAVVNGLNANCVGGLNVRLSYRVTLDDCPEGSCTETDVNDFDLVGASCIVTNGKCKINTTLNTAAPGLIPTNGKNAGIEIFGCGLKGFGFGAFPAELQCGVLLK